MNTSSAQLGLPLCALVLTLSLAGPASSESGPDYGETGAYVGLGFALGFDNVGGGLGVADLDPSYGFDAWGGYRFHPNFATELRLEYLNGFNLTTFDPSTGITELSTQGVTFTGNLKYYLLTGRFQPFLQAGIGLGWQEQSVSSDIGAGSIGATGLAAPLGGGIDFYLTENLALQVSASYVFVRYGLNEQFPPIVFGDRTDYVNVIFGAQYRF